MSNYFEAVIAKTVKSGNLFEFVQCNLEKLPQYLEQENKNFIKKRGKVYKFEHGHKVRKMYRKWRRRISQGHNIIVQGLGSKKRLLDGFSYRYLQRENITIVRLHGLESVSEQVFANSVFKQDEGTAVNQENLLEYTRSLSDTRQHNYFIIHSFEEFYKNSKKVCELIFDLIKLAPRYVHMVASSDHINGGMLTSYYKLQLNLICFHHSTWRSYFFERCRSSTNSQVNNDALNDVLMHNELTLSSLLSVYSAMQENVKKIMQFILEHFIQAEDEQHENKTTRHKKSKGPKKLMFQTLFNYTEREFIVRRHAQLRNHLDELADHNIIIIEGQSNTELSMVLNVPIEIARKFLEEISSLNNES